MKSLIILMSLFSISTWAAIDDMPLGSTKSETKTVKIEEPIGWSVEGGIMFDSVAENSSPMINAAIGKKVTVNNTLMFNSAMPIGVDDDDLNAYKASLVWRYFFVNRKTRLYSEVVGNLYFIEYNGGGGENFGTAGWALGTQHMLSNEMSIGGSAGFDFSRYEIEGNAVFKQDGTLVQPKVAVNGSFHF